MLYGFGGAEADDFVEFQFQQLMDIFCAPRSGFDFYGYAPAVLFGMDIDIVPLHGCAHVRCKVEKHHFAGSGWNVHGLLYKTSAIVQRRSAFFG